MIVKVDLDPRTVWALEDRAEKLGLSLSEYVARRVAPKGEVRGRGVTAEHTRAEVLRLHAEGLPDEVIAARVGRVKEHVARLRRAAGLKPNRRAV